MADELERIEEMEPVGLSGIPSLLLTRIAERVPYLQKKMNYQSWDLSALHSAANRHDLFAIFGAVLAVVSALLAAYSLIAGRLVGAELKRRAVVEEQLKSDITRQLVLKAAPRIITPDKWDAFLKLTKLAPKGNIRFAITGRNKESEDFKEQLANMLAAAGYTIDSQEENLTNMFTVAGVAMNTRDNKLGAPQAKPLHDALKAIGIDCPLNTKVWPPGNLEDVKIVVGLKE